MGADSPLDESFVLLRVLVADSGTSVNDGLTALLSEIDGISVFGCAQSPGRLLALAGPLRPDVLILDVQCAEPVDLDILRRQKALPAAPFVIALCDYDLQQLRDEVIAEGADAVLGRTDCDSLLQHLQAQINKKERQCLKVMPWISSSSRIIPTMPSLRSGP